MDGESRVNTARRSFVEFWGVGYTGAATAWLEPSDNYPGGRVVKCPVCRVQGIKPLPRTQPPCVGIWIAKPGTLDDVSSLGFYKLVSERCREVIRESRLTGVRFVLPAEIVSKGAGPRWAATERMITDKLKLRVMYVTGRGGSVANDRRVRRIDVCDKCGWEDWKLPRSGKPVLVDEWDGSDFFYVDEYIPMLMTPHAAKCLEDAGLSGFAAEKTAFAARNQV